VRRDFVMKERLEHASMLLNVAMVVLEILRLLQQLQQGWPFT
jgi:hypothetical protein